MEHATAEVLIVDDHRLFRRGVQHLLDRIRQAAALVTAVSGPRTAGADALDRLTGRERDILRALAKGASNKMIARQFDIAEGTVKVHVKSLLKKLGLRSRVEAAVWAVNHHLQ